MTKRWSSTASMDGQTKRQASKRERRRYNPEMVKLLRELRDAPPEATFDNIDDLMRYLAEPKRGSA